MDPYLVAFRDLDEHPQGVTDVKQRQALPHHQPFD
jgi:hypothetical protein